MAYLHQGEKKMARQAVERAIQLSPSLPHPHILQAQLSLQDRLFTVAREQAQRALILKPDSKEAGIIIGLSYLNEHNTSQAIEKFTILSQLYQNDPAILRYLGLAYLQDNAIDKARSTFTHILSIDPGYSPALSSLVDISLSQNDLEGAYQWVRRQLEIAPDKPENHLVLSNLLIREKKYSEAISQLKQAQKIDPLNTSVLHALAKVYALSGEDRLAVVEYRKLLADDPGITSAYMELAALLIKMNDPDGAQQLYRDLLRIRPSNTQAANNLAWLIAEDDEGDLGEAFRFALMARQKDSGNPYTWDTLGWVYYKRGEHEKAMEEIQGAVNMKPSEPVFYYHLAVIYQKKGEYFKAVELLKKCVSLEKPFADRQKAEELLRQLQ
jgi:Flp pilus assembly protein TadD